LAAARIEANRSFSFSDMYSNTDFAFDTRASSPSASPR
jgi:hypothetical protein